MQIARNNLVSRRGDKLLARTTSYSSTRHTDETATPPPSSTATIRYLSVCRHRRARHERGIAIILVRAHTHTLTPNTNREYEQKCGAPFRRLIMRGIYIDSESLASRSCRAPTEPMAALLKNYHHRNMNFAALVESRLSSLLDHPICVCSRIKHSNWH